MMYIVFAWILFMNYIGVADGVYSAAKETEIRTETVLAAAYDHVSRPAAQTAVSISLSLLAIDELDLKNQKLTAAGWLTLEWTDSRITWTPAAKDDIESIFATPATIWIPELVVDNSLADLGVIEDEHLYLRAEYTGLVEWEPLRLFTVHCQVDITYYPYDKQKCGIDVVSWGYTYDEVKLELLKTEVSLEDFEENGEWLIDKTEVELKNLTETTSSGVVRQFPQITFWLYMDRRTEFYNLNIMIPIIGTSLLAILAFVVPVESGEKVSYVLTVFLSLAVLLTIVADTLPSTSITTSVLGVYLTVVSLLSGIACFLTVYIIIFYHKEGSPPESSNILKLARCFARFTCTPFPDPVKKSSRRASRERNKVNPNDGTIRVKMTREGTEVNSIKPNDDDNEITWQRVSIVVDKFCFYVFATFTIVSNIVFVMALTIGGAVTSVD